MRTVGSRDPGIAEKPCSAVAIWEARIRIDELGEFGLIAAITQAMTPGAGGNGAVLIGAGDDAAVLRAPDGRTVATTDMMLEDRHFRMEWSSASDIGHKAAARNLADVAAMGAVPTALLVAFAGPGDLSLEWVTDLAAGIARECDDVGAVVAGGDTSSADKVLIAITALGDLAGQAPVTRSGARPGDLVAVAGQLGSAAAGLSLLAADADLSVPTLAVPTLPVPTLPVPTPAVPTPAVPTLSVPEGNTLAGLVQAHRRPRPPYAAGPAAGLLGATSMIDISDGLIADLGHVAEASDVRIELSSSLLADDRIARLDALRQASAVLGLPDWLPWVLTGGDDHALAATFPATAALPSAWTVVGAVTRGHGVLVDQRNWADHGGWEHFRS